ncbi:MAG: tRNA-intron lyase [Candidatus Micrarchaeota archaeon]|nr:tRNA-intron lyase [Candidatus Micrarchaeota archaeon]
MAYIIENFVVEDNENMVKLLYDRGYGTIDKTHRLVLSPLEALYLLENKRIEVSSPSGKKVDFATLMKKFAAKEPDIDIRYAVYSDLRSKGYIVKTGYGFGTSLRVYEKGIRPNEGRSHILTEVMSDGKRISLLELQRLVRAAQLTRKNLMLAIVREDKKIKYFKVASAQL